MFNPLTEDTKVAVTATAAKSPQPCIFSNYNGGTRSETLGYNLIRANRSGDDAFISEAAASTSAAPWFFKPVVLRNLGTFQDGGLQHNNPLNLALWEVKLIWPNKPLPDFALSIGTGSNENTFRVGPQSPVRKRFLARIFDTFMENMDGEKLWRDFWNGLSEQQQERYHRLNLTLPHPQPSIDDITVMHYLRDRASAYMLEDKKIQPIVDSAISSVFYFELEELPAWQQKSFCYLCTGTIYCRALFTLQGRRKFAQSLAASSAYFLVRGDPIACVQRVGKRVPPFRKRIQFTVKRLDESIGITLRGITSKPVYISGMPQSPCHMIQSQQLDTPFGNSCSAVPEKPLPPTPMKRSAADAGWI